MPAIALDLSLDPEDAPGFSRAPGLLADGVRGRPAGLDIIWHDTPGRALAANGLALAEHHGGRGTTWRLERMGPSGTAAWQPGALPSIIAQAHDFTEIIHALDNFDRGGTLIPVAAFAGLTHELSAGPVAVTMLSGVARAVAGERAVCRVTIAGEAAAVGALIEGLAGSLRLAVSCKSLAEEAFATAGAPLPAIRPGAPELTPTLSVGDAFSWIVGHLTNVILRQAALVVAGEAPEPVHQMRVALRRLRSAVQIFRRAVCCPELDAAKPMLKRLGETLGSARDWDVFIGGAAARARAASPGDAALARLEAKARRRRDAAYAALRAYLDSAAFRQLGLALALLAAARPWEIFSGTPVTPDDPPVEQDAGATRLSVPLTAFAARALRKRHARLLAPGPAIASLPTPDLHAIRLDAKRLRYAAEFFAPLFPGRHARRFLRRLGALQERLGLLNDGAASAGLLAEIGQSRAYAGGLVLGAIAAEASGARGKIERSWNKVLRLEPFWR